MEKEHIYYDRNLNKFIGLDDKEFAKLERAFPGIDIEAELNKMGLWLNSSKGKRRIGSISFILNWLRNVGKTLAPVRDHTRSTSMVSLINDYLEDLWKNRQHILEFNQIRKKS